jgi:AcrR family transcriptional regulator
MKAALGLFSRKGLEDTSVEEICLAAGYSKGGFYFHFAGKDDLLAQILNATVDPADECRLGALDAELWSQAARNQDVRRRLAYRFDVRRRDLLRDAPAIRETQTSAPPLLDLLLLLDDGLRVQHRFAPSRAGEAQVVVDSLLTTLGGPLAQSWQGAGGER